MAESVTTREAKLSDLSELQSLFVKTIRKIAIRDYSPAQIEAWVAGVRNQQRWENAIQDQYFLVATLKSTIVGFGSLTEDAYLDFLYVHKDYQRKGVAKTLYQALEEEAIRNGHHQITTDASKTAQGFFAARGFSVTQENQKLIKGIEIINYRMKKVL
jgi:putative acetyltransferase